MQQFGWLTFGLSSGLTRTLVHFFPSSGGVSAPYPVNCHVSCFGSSFEPKSAVLEGGRLSQPDGVRIDEVFPQVTAGDGIFGLEITLSPTQQKIDLTHSSCVIELGSGMQSARFFPALSLSDDGMVQSRNASVAIKDAFHETSIIVVNRSKAPVTPSILSFSGAASREAVSLLGSNCIIEPQSAKECSIDKKLFEEITPFECSWGLVRSRPIFLSGNLPPGVACYVMYRDAATTRPVSVSLL